MFNPNVTPEHLNQMNQGNMGEHLGIEFTEIGKDFIKAKMPVDHRTTQPFGLLHGGASVVLAETLGSVSAHLTVDSTLQFCVGLDINANHIRSARSGYVYGTSTPIHVGKQTQVWQIKIVNDEGDLICISRITMAVLDKKK